MFDETTFDGVGNRLNVAVGPESGPPLVLLHGVTRRWQSFVPLLNALSSRWQIFALDFRGHGSSQPTNAGYTTIDYIDDVALLLNNVIQTPAVIYGHSLGAMVTAATAAGYPDLIRGIVMEDPPFHTMGRRIRQTPLHGYFTALQRFAGTEDSVAETAAELADLEMTDPSSGRSTRLGDVRDHTSLRFAARCLADLDPAVLTPIVNEQWLDNYDCDGVMQSVHCPALLLQADPACGGMLTDTDADSFASLAPDCTRIRLQDVGHVIHWMRTEELQRHVLGFLESL